MTTADAVSAAQLRYKTLLVQCPHHIIQQNESAYYTICKQIRGWYCDESPSHICKPEYNDEYGEDVCIYCAAPDERK